MSEVPECLVCGTCCFSRLETYVRVSGDDHARFGDRAEELVWFDGNRAYMRMVDGHCGALGVDVSSGQLVCGTYETRPQTCRDLARGSPACLGEIETKRDRPLLALGRAAIALSLTRAALAALPAASLDEMPPSSQPPGGGAFLKTSR